MKFKFECDDGDGLVFLDESVLSELNEELLYALDILLDYSGKSELIYDFPNEKWDEVWTRETKLIKDFCDAGKMVVWLMDYTDKEIELENRMLLGLPEKLLYVSSGKVIAVMASELIQCLSYPELDMEKLVELEVESGWYAMAESGDKIIYYRK